MNWKYCLNKRQRIQSTFPRGGGALPQSPDGCVPRRVLNPDPILRMNEAKNDTLSKTQIQKLTPYSREEQEGEKRCITIHTTTNRHGKTQSF